MVAAIQGQNVQVVEGQLGAPPVPADQALQFTVNALGRLSDVEQFEKIIIKSERSEAAQIVRVRDVARVELSRQTYANFSTARGHRATAIPIFSLPGANALDVADRVKAAIADMAKPLPPGLTYEIRYDTQRVLGAERITRYNLCPAAQILGTSAPGFSSGQAIGLMEHADESALPRGMAYDWTASSYQEKRVGNQAYFIYALSITLVFLVLAALYESWSAPAAVILTVPMALVGVQLALLLRELDANLYTQVGLVLTIALASKNAILVVKFARQLRAEGMSVAEAAVEATRRRFRPILMTSFAFILGVAPLVFATGAGAASRQAIGTVGFGGMLASTLLAVPFVPVFFVLAERLSDRFARRAGRKPQVKTQGKSK